MDKQIKLITEEMIEEFEKRGFTIHKEGTRFELKGFSVTIPEGVTEIGDGVFAGCTSLKSIVIPEGVTKIGDGAFEDTPWGKSAGYEGSVIIDS